MTPTPKQRMTPELIVEMCKGKTFSGADEALKWLSDRIQEACTQAHAEGYKAAIEDAAKVVEDDLICGLADVVQAEYVKAIRSLRPKEK